MTWKPAIFATASFASWAAVSGQVQAEQDDDPPLSAYDDIRGRQNDQSSTKIIDGTEVAPGKFPRIVGITKGTSPNPACAGSLYANDMILTAAHCICDVVKGSSGLPNANILIGNGPGDQKRVYYPSIGFYSNITCNNLKDDDLPGRDWGLVQIKKLTTAGVTIATPSAIDTAKIFSVVGYGAVDLAGTTTDFRKRIAQIPSVSAKCAGMRDGVADAKVYGCKAGLEIVAGQRRGPDSCRGDSGGPLLVLVGAGYHLAGITSRSIPNTPTRCGNGGVYLRLTPQLVAQIETQANKLRKGVSS